MSKGEKTYSSDENDNSQDDSENETDSETPEPKFTSRTKTKIVWGCIDKKAYQIHEYWMRKTGKVCYVKLCGCTLRLLR